MLKIRFLNVGQGDSIVIEWVKNGVLNIGIIDCNLYNGRNPTLDYLRTKSNFKLEFIILSHFHEDHFSGMAELFDYCVSNSLKVEGFYHSFTQFQLDVYDRVFTSQRLNNQVRSFFEKYDLFESAVSTESLIQNTLSPIELDTDMRIKFLAPVGKVYSEMGKKLSRKKNKITTTIADINKFATILLLEVKDKAIILTSDAVKKSYKLLIGKVSHEIILAQAPHHGSWGNVDPKFWNALSKIPNCPVVFSVGDEPKDELPNVKSVEFFDQSGFHVRATNNVYGITSYFGAATPSFSVHPTSALLNMHSTLRRQVTSLPPSRFAGDHSFIF